HGLEHVGEGLADLGRHGFHRLGLLPENGVAVAPDVQDGPFTCAPDILFSLVLRLCLSAFIDLRSSQGLDLRSSQGTTSIRRLGLSLFLPHGASAGGARGGVEAAPRAGAGGRRAPSPGCATRAFARPACPAAWPHTCEGPRCRGARPYTPRSARGPPPRSCLARRGGRGGDTGDNPARPGTAAPARRTVAARAGVPPGSHSARDAGSGR